MRSTFRILFYVNRSKNKGELIPIMGRITINGTMAQFSCKCYIEKDLWGTHENRALGNSKRAREINMHLDTLRSEILRCYQMLLRSNYIVSARMVKNELFKSKNDYKTILEAVKEEIQNFATRVNKDRSIYTFNKMKAVEKHLKNYIIYKYGAKDFYIQELTDNFIQCFWEYLIYNMKLNNSTAWVYCTFLKKIVLKEFNKGYLRTNPFKDFKIAPKIKAREFLTEEELRKLLEHPYKEEVKIQITHIFLFCCFTGISFTDTFALKWENIQTINNQIWIFSNRKKTGVPYQVLLIHMAKYALECVTKGSDCNPQKHVFPQFNYAKANRVLKDIAKECNISKNLTWHIARHTFATLALTKGMSIESVSKILGHTNINTTQIYAKIINEKLTHEFNIIDKKMRL